MKIKIFSTLAIIILLSSISASISWESGTDWNSASSEENVVHGDNHDYSGAGIVHLGYNHDKISNENKLLGYWPLIDGGGSTAMDLTGNNPGEYGGNPNLATDGPLNHRAPSFDGVDDMVYKLNNTDDLLLDSSFSVVAWVKSDVPGEYNQQWAAVSLYNTYILGARHNQRDEFGLIVHDNDRSNGWAEDGGTSQVSSPNQWNLFVGTYEEKGTSNDPVYTYINDGKNHNYHEWDMDAECRPEGGGDHCAPTFMHRERKPFGDQHMSGKLFGVRIYNKTLSQDKASEIYQTTQKGHLTTGFKTFSNEIEPSSLSLENIQGSLNGGQINVTVISDEGEKSDHIKLDGSGNYDVEGISTPADRFKLNITLISGSVTATPTISSVDLDGDVSSVNFQYSGFLFDFDRPYDGIVLSEGGTDLFGFDVLGNDSKEYNVSVTAGTGVESEFQSSYDNGDVVDLNSKNRFILNLEGSSPGFTTLNLTLTDESTGVKKRQEFEVRVREYEVGSREVSGIGFLPIIMVLFASIVMRPIMT
jgi:hypothetical protein